jgi:hypothetical protein
MISSFTASLVSGLYFLAVQASRSSLKGSQKFLACIGCGPWTADAEWCFLVACGLFKGTKGLDLLGL